jgi:hypothetical protein
MSEVIPERLRALLREAHSADDPPPSFDRLVARARSPRRSARISGRLATAGILVGAAAALSVALLTFKRERPLPPVSPAAVAWSTRWEGPLDFLLQLPQPAVDALPSLTVPDGYGNSGRQEKVR